MSNTTRKTIRKTDRGVIKSEYVDGAFIRNVEVWEDSDGIEHIDPVALTPEELQASYGNKCMFNYTNSSGKKTAVQTEPAKFIRLHGDKYITSVNKVTWHGKETSMFLVWDKSKVDDRVGEAYPVHISDLGKERDIEIIKAIQATKFAF